MIVKTSKFLSLVLRHKPEILNLNMDKNGWVVISELLAKMKKAGKPITRDELNEVVLTNNKKRFKINDEKTKIRASQGHSIEVDLDLKQVIPPVILYHGTATKNLDSIMKIGIKKRNRQHVHLSKDKETAIKVGSRHGKVIVLKIDCKKMIENNFIFFLSDNGVWLTDNVPSKYISLH